MSDSDRPSRHGLTPVPFDLFDEPAPRRDTEPATMLPEEPLDLGDGKTTVRGFERAFARVDDALEKISADMRALDTNSADFRNSMNVVRTLMLDHYGRVNLKFDGLIKALRWFATEDRDRRVREGLDPSPAPVDDL